MTTEIKVNDLQNTSKNWNFCTKELLLHYEGSANMFGGCGKMLHVVLHGENSTTETGTITVKGIVETGYNIARGANGDNYATAKYYPGTSFDANQKPAYEVKISGSCGGHTEAMAAILSAEIDWIVK